MGYSTSSACKDRCCEADITLELSCVCFLQIAVAHKDKVWFQGSCIWLDLDQLPDALKSNWSRLISHKLISHCWFACILVESCAESCAESPRKDTETTKTRVQKATKAVLCLLSPDKKPGLVN